MASGSHPRKSRHPIGNDNESKTDDTLSNGGPRTSSPIYVPITEPLTPMVDEQFDSETDQIMLALRSQEMSKDQLSEERESDTTVQNSSWMDLMDSDTDKLLVDLEMSDFTATDKNDTWEKESDIDDVLGNLSVPDIENDGHIASNPEKADTSSQPKQSILKSLLQEPSDFKEPPITNDTIKKLIEKHRRQPSPSPPTASVQTPVGRMLQNEPGVVAGPSHTYRPSTSSEVPVKPTLPVPGPSHCRTSLEQVEESEDIIRQAWVCMTVFFKWEYLFYNSGINILSTVICQTYKFMATLV